MTAPESIETRRLSLPAATAEQLEALIAGNRERFESLIGVSAPDPLVAPPETGDVLEWFRDAILRDPGIRPWFFRWVVDREQGQLVGSAGFAGRPDDNGYVLLGYSVYPEYEKRGIASEAAAALVAWALSQSGVTRVRATIKPDNEASKKVAQRAGLSKVDEIDSEEDGRVELWEIAGAISMGNV